MAQRLTVKSPCWPYGGLEFNYQHPWWVAHKFQFQGILRPLLASKGIASRLHPHRYTIKNKMFKNMFRNKILIKTFIVYESIILIMSDIKGLNTFAFFYFSWGNSWRISAQKMQNNILKQTNKKHFAKKNMIQVTGIQRPRSCKEQHWSVGQWWKKVPEWLALL